MELLLVHPGKAYLPELRAYERAFSAHFEVRSVTADALHGRSHPGKILYFIMGFYPGRYEAHQVVHDYRSLSVGAAPGLKDGVKRRLQARPDLRVFANEVIEREMGFKDRVPTCRLEMGVHLDLIPGRSADRTIDYDFCYAGDVSRERRGEVMLHEFLGRADGRTLALAGRVDPGIATQFRHRPEFVFLGRLSLPEVYQVLFRSETGICYLPNRRPYCFQTPVKVLEYAALGLKVVVNDTPSNVETLERHEIEGLVMPDYTFPGRAEVERLPDNREFDATRIGWERVIADSGVVEYLLS